jgi:hypothetical protein
MGFFFLMQETRLNILLNLILNNIRRFFANPWRKLSLIFVFLLFGFFMASAIASTTGQAARWDITVAAILLIFTEISSIIAYRRSANKQRSPNSTTQSLFIDLLNYFKMGIIYGLFLEAFKLNS